jgi:hypothetical protein
MNQKANKKIRADLERIREWAGEKIGAGDEPPWAWYQYMKLRETLDAILGGMDAISPTGNLLQSEPRSENGLRLVASNDPRDTARRRRAGTPVQLPT